MYFPELGDMTEGVLCSLPIPRNGTSSGKSILHTREWSAAIYHR
jgi:hypothetical protein